MITPSSFPSAPSPASLQRLSAWPTWLLSGNLALVVAAELLVAFREPLWGLAVHLLLIALLVAIHAWIRQDVARQLTLALLLVPLIRVLSLAMPLAIFPRAAWPAIVAVPLLIAVWQVVCRGDLSRRAIGLSTNGLGLQLAVAATGPGLGALAFVVMPQPVLADGLSWEVLWLPALSLLIGAGLVEELIFRGVLQAALLRAAGRWALVYGAVLFAALQLGQNSAAFLVYTLACGIGFGAVAWRTSSIVGVALSHGVANVIYLIVMPLLTQATGSLDVALSALLGGYVLAILSIAAMLLLREAGAARPGSEPAIGSLLRGARIEANLTYVALALRTGMSVRLLAEIEHGMRAPLPDDVERIKAALRLSPLASHSTASDAMVP